MKNQDELLKLGLPKWPQMYTTGKPVSEDQAIEIIRRTDYFFRSMGGNDEEFTNKIRTSVGMPILDYRAGHEKAFHEACKTQDAWRQKWECLWTSYVDNDWITCSYIYGPHGWMHPDGSVGFEDNVGKWPEAEEVLTDWKKIAKIWDFLDVGVTLMSGEHCEDGTRPVVSICVKDGGACLVDPAKEDVHEDHPKLTLRGEVYDENLIEYLNTEPRIRECGLDPKHFQYFEQVAKEKGLV